MSQPNTIQALIDRQAAQQPDAPYFLAVPIDAGSEAWSDDGSEAGSEAGADPAAAMSYAQLQASCMRVAGWLQALGARPGDKVSLVMPNGLQTVRLLLGALYGGYCVNPVNLLAQPDQMRYVLDHSDSTLVLVDPEWLDRVQDLLAGIERRPRVAVVNPHAHAMPEADPWHPAPYSTDSPPAVSPDADAVLMYTSGTTGRPKGVLLTQRALAANAIAVSREHALGPSDRVLAVLPLYHINGLVVTVLSPLAHGGSVAMPARFSARVFWHWVVQNGCTWLNMVPTMVSYLLEGESPARDALRAVRFCRTASAALPPEHHRAFEAKFGIGIIETMGLTETAAPSFSNPFDAQRRKIGSVGRASGGEAKVIDADGHELPDGAIGEIIIRGPQVMRGYYKNPEATAAAFTADGWLRTGDLGFRDADGFFFVTGRIKELIIKGGENIAPREIDEALLKHPAILDAAAVGIPDRHYGQEIMACVVLRAGAACSQDELKAFCTQHLGKYKTPKLFRFLPDLPRGPSGKVQRLKLLEVE